MSKKKMPKYLTGKGNTRKKGKKGENLVKDTINSGALWFKKGDLDAKDFLIEVKKTDKKGFRITNKLIEKVVREAYTVKKEPLIVLVLPNHILHVRIKIR